MNQTDKIIHLIVQWLATQDNGSLILWIAAAEADEEHTQHAGPTRWTPSFREHVLDRTDCLDHIDLNYFIHIDLNYFIGEVADRHNTEQLHTAWQNYWHGRKWYE